MLGFTLGWLRFILGWSGSVLGLPGILDSNWLGSVTQNACAECAGKVTQNNQMLGGLRSGGRLKTEALNYFRKMNIS